MQLRYFEKRPGAWHIDFRDRTGVRKRPYAGATRAEAERNAPNVIADTLRPTAASPVASDSAPKTRPSPSRMTLREAFDRAYADREGRSSRVGLRTFEQTYRQLGLDDATPVRTFGTDKVLALRDGWMDEGGKARGSRPAPGTINGRLSMLSTLLEVAGQPPHAVKHIPTKRPKAMRRISDAEMERCRAWLIAEGDGRFGAVAFACLMTFAVECGAREDEMIGLRWEDLAGTSATLREVKSGRVRTVPLSPAAVGAVETLRGAAGGPFAALDRRLIARRWDEMSAGLGLAEAERFTLMDLRHEFASRLVDKGIDSFTIMKRMAGGVVGPRGPNACRMGC